MRRNERLVSVEKMDVGGKVTTTEPSLEDLILSYLYCSGDTASRPSADHTIEAALYPLSSPDTVSFHFRTPSAY